VDGDERPVGAARAVMNRLDDEVLARPTLALQQRR
jgi:hypothetical protein